MRSIPLARAAVVIPTWNGEEDLRKTLPALRSVDGGEDLQVLTIDSGSSDGTHRVAAEFGAQVAVIPPGSFNHGGTRNLGISLLESEIAILLTQDAVPADRDWLNRILEPFEDLQVAGVYARQIAPQDAHPRAKAEQAYVDGSDDMNEIRRIETPDEWFQLSAMDRYRRARFDNVCSAIRRSVWERLPFAMAPYGEDLDWGLRVLQAGYSLAYEPRCKVWHAHERPARYVLRRTIVDHQLLADRFRLQTIPAWWYVPKAVLSSILWEIRNARASEPGAQKRKRLKAALPVGLASALGQYIGARRWRTGHPRAGQPGV